MLDIQILIKEKNSINVERYLILGRYRLISMFGYDSRKESVIADKSHDR